MSTKEIKYLKDYKKPEYLIKTTSLDFEIFEEFITVKSKIAFVKNDTSSQELILNGEELITESVIMDGKALKENEDYKITKDKLHIFNPKDRFVLETKVKINPYQNTTLMGIYKSNTCICSQCEPEGFRRITWFLDRPDVMSTFTVSITAPTNAYRTLLSNGNLISEEIKGDKKTATFIDPYPKPSYLFAFVAGNFDSVSSIFKTKTNKEVALNVFVEEGKKDQAHFALKSLETSMKWDEDTFNLEYELDIFSIVAVSDFNFGAMENKSLNIFNDAYVLANPYIATDDDYFNVESIVAHEYFHNFTGNRITCRDWFQLTLKEGLTVFRDHKFSQDLHNKSVVRISEVEVLRNHQFTEDSSALSHPIRPTSYIEMNNFYTATVYEKGSEIIRMIETLIGEDNFKKGIDVYFANFDGQAVTCEDFVWAMEQASGISLDNFKKWYFQSGTPIVKVEISYTNKTFTVLLEQINNPTSDQKEKQNLVIPLKLALISAKGDQIELITNGKSLGKEHVAILEDKTLALSFEVLGNDVPTLSINRGFSAPVILDFKQEDNNNINLLLNDSDGFARYEASQNYLKKYMLEYISKLENNQAFDTLEVEKILQPYSKILENYKQDIAFTSLLLKIPAFNSFEVLFKKDLPIESIVEVIKIFEDSFAKLFEEQFKNIFMHLEDTEDEFSAQMMAIRQLKNKALYYLVKTQKPEYFKLAQDYYNNTTSMTKRIGTLVALKNYPAEQIQQDIMASFYKEYGKYPTVLNKWFQITASISYENPIAKVKDLMELETFSFTNPNKVRSVVAGFMSNHKAFHNMDGSGYKFLEEIIIKLDKINPSLSARLSTSFSKIALYKLARQELIKLTLQNILAKEGISKGLYEVITKTLDAKQEGNH